jgi:hypothetical protein
MQHTLAQKMHIKPGWKGVVLNPPANIAITAFEFDDLVQIVTDDHIPLDFVIVFVSSTDELRRHASHIISLLGPTTALWAAYPKKSGSLMSDISRDNGWDAFTEHDLLGVANIAFDQDWSLIRFKRRSDFKRIVRTF